LKAAEVPEKMLMSQTHLFTQLAALGKMAGPPWSKDQKEAALAVMLALEKR
jgi:hypothetical protein